MSSIAEIRAAIAAANQDVTEATGRGPRGDCGEPARGGFVPADTRGDWYGRRYSGGIGQPVHQAVPLPDVVSNVVVVAVALVKGVDHVVDEVLGMADEYLRTAG